MLTRVGIRVEVSHAKQVKMLAASRGIDEADVWREVVSAGLRVMSGQGFASAESVEVLSENTQLMQRMLIETLCMTRRSVATQNKELFEKAREDSIAMIKDLADRK